jgi:glycosyltransferase involved in cell wall biosynthesis
VVARRADLCVLPNAQRLARFTKELGPLRNSACVWNCPGLDEIPATAAAPAQDPLWLLYHGTIVPDRLPPAVLDSLALLPDNVNLRVVGYETAGAPGYVAELRRKAESLGLGDRVEFLKPVSRKDLFAITQRSGIGLALIPRRSNDVNFQAMTGASNKVFDYLACGLPVIVSSIPEWIEMFVWPGYGIACNPADPKSLAAAIRELIADPGRLRQTGERGRQRILAEWNYETMFRPVFHRMSGGACAVAAPSPGHAQEAAEALPK